MITTSIEMIKVLFSKNWKIKVFKKIKLKEKITNNKIFHKN